MLKLRKSPLLLIFIISIIFRYLLAKISLFIPNHDELIYLEIAKNISEISNPTVRSVIFPFQQILYPLIISPAFIIKDPVISYEIIKFINATLLSSAVFPAYLIGKGILKNNKYATILATISILIPEMFFTSLVMSESLFYPLSLWFIYFVWEYINEKDDNTVISILKMSSALYLLYLTKIVSLYFIPALVLLTFYEVITEKSRLKKILLLSIIIAAAIMSYIFYMTAIGRFQGHYFNSVLYTILSLNFNKIIYIFYSVGIFFIYTAFIYLIYPVISPLFSFKEQALEQKKMTVFIFASLICAFFTVAITISAPETFPERLPTLHLRYFFPIIIPVIALFLYCSKFELKIPIIVPISILLMFILGISLDSMPQLAYMNPNNVLSLQIDYKGINIKLFWHDYVRIVTLASCIYMTKSCNNSFSNPIKMITPIIILFIITNAIIYTANFRDMNSGINRSLVKQAVKVSNFLSSQQGKSLIISHYFLDEKILETYLKSKYYLTLEKNFNENLSESNNIFKVEFTAVSIGTKWDATYAVIGCKHSINSVDFIILGHNVNTVELKGLLDVTPEGIKNYKIYKIKS